MKTDNSRHPIDLGEILREHGPSFIENHQLCSGQLKAISAIQQCRSSSLGGHVNRCNQCGHQKIAYNSCRNRNCNKCQYTKQLIWVDQLKSRLPVCRYFHMVFTIPHELHKTFYLNQRVCYNLMFKASALTLKKVAQNPKFLGAETGAVSVLHTWGQSLVYHPHIHMLIPAGGLSSDGVEWMKAGRKFFLPVKALSKVFRGVLWNMLQKAVQQGKLRLPGKEKITCLKQQLYRKNWHIYSKKPLAGPQSVIQYLGKYTHRVAISNNRIIKVADGKVTFRWKDYRKGLKNQLLSLNIEEFIGRFCMHILPNGFYKIRYYGLLASANIAKKERCFLLLKVIPPVSLLKGLTVQQVVKIVTGKDLGLCPKCNKGRLLPHTILDPI